MAAVDTAAEEAATQLLAEKKQAEAHQIVRHGNPWARPVLLKWVPFVKV